MHRRRGDEDRDRAAGIDELPIDEIGKQGAKRVEVEGIVLIGREHPHHELEPLVGDGVVDVPVLHPLVERGCLERAVEAAKIADGAPEPVERRPRPGPAAGAVAMRQHDGVHRPGAGAAHAIRNDVLFLEQAVEHAPAIGAMRTTTLQCNVQPFGVHPASPGRPTGRCPDRDRRAYSRSMGRAPATPWRGDFLDITSLGKQSGLSWGS